MPFFFEGKQRFFYTGSRISRKVFGLFDTEHVGGTLFRNVGEIYHLTRHNIAKD
jgi:hypothetical protein